MAHSKNKKQSNQKKESKDERRARLAAEAEAREFCFQILPYIGAGLFILLVTFALWVQTVQPKEYMTTPMNGNINMENIQQIDPSMFQTTAPPNNENNDMDMSSGNIIGDHPESEPDETTIEL